MGNLNSLGFVVFLYISFARKTLEFGIDIYASFSNDKSLLSFLAISLTSDGDSVVHWGGCREKSVWEL